MALSKLSILKIVEWDSLKFQSSRTIRILRYCSLRGTHTSLKASTPTSKTKTDRANIGAVFSTTNNKRSSSPAFSTNSTKPTKPAPMILPFSSRWSPSRCARWHKLRRRDWYQWGRCTCRYCYTYRMISTMTFWWTWSTYLISCETLLFD